MPMFVFVTDSEPVARKLRIHAPPGAIIQQSASGIVQMHIMRWRLSDDALMELVEKVSGVVLAEVPRGAIVAAVARAPGSLDEHLKSMGACLCPFGEPQ